MRDEPETGTSFQCGVSLKRSLSGSAAAMSFCSFRNSEVRPWRAPQARACFPRFGPEGGKPSALWECGNRVFVRFPRTVGSGGKPAADSDAGLWEAAGFPSDVHRSVISTALPVVHSFAPPWPRHRFSKSSLALRICRAASVSLLRRARRCRSCSLTPGFRYSCQPGSEVSFSNGVR